MNLCQIQHKYSQFSGIIAFILRHSERKYVWVFQVVCVSCCSRLLNSNTVFMTGFVKTEHRQGHNLPLPLSTLSRYLCISPHSSLSPRKSISRSLHSKVHYSLLPAAFSVCYLSHSHYLCLSLQLSSLSSLYWSNQTWCSFSLTFFRFFPSFSIRLAACVPPLPRVVQPLFLPTYFCPYADGLCRSSAFSVISNLLYFSLLLPITPSPPLLPHPPPLPLPDSPPWCCMHFITFGSANLKKKRIYANAELKNECSPPLQCAEESSEAPHYNIFSLLWIRGIIIKNDLWCWNEAEPLLLPGNSPNTSVTIHVDRHGDRVHNQQSDYEAIWQSQMRDRPTGCSAKSFVSDCCFFFYCFVWVLTWWVEKIITLWHRI